MTVLKSYDLNGKKLSFANWISNLSPQDTPFTSMTGKESIDQTVFQWQTDSLQIAGENAVGEGTDAKGEGMRTTSLKKNIAQIMRRVVKVSDTADALVNYGRGKELQYQMEKAGIALKRDAEWAFLNNFGAEEERPGRGRVTAGFRGLVAPLHATCIDTGAMVHDSTLQPGITEEDLFNLTYNLYMAGSVADIIMYHPKWAVFFSSLQEARGEHNRQRIFKDSTKVEIFINTITDPLGQVYKLVPNRWMPEGSIYFFAAKDWTQMVLRNPARTKLCRNGSYEKWMLEMEVGLRHRHPFASGILDVEGRDGIIQGHDPVDFIHPSADLTHSAVFSMITPDPHGSIITELGNIVEMSESVSFIAGARLVLNVIAEAGTVGVGSSVTVLKDGVEVWSTHEASDQRISLNMVTIIERVSLADAGNYTVQIHRPDKGTYTTSALMMDVVKDDIHAGATR